MSILDGTIMLYYPSLTAFYALGDVLSQSQQDLPFTMSAVLAPILGDATTASFAVTHGSMDCAGGQESLGLQVSIFSFLFTLKGHCLQVLHLGQFQKLNLILPAICMGRCPPAPEVMPGAFQPLAPAQAHWARCMNLHSCGLRMQSQLSSNDQWACSAPAPPGASFLAL